jgi:cell division protein FtsB
MDNGTTPPTLSHIFRRPVPQVRLSVLTAWLLALAVLAFIGAVYLAQASQAAQEGADLETLQYRLSDLQRTNAQLEADVAMAQQPERLARRAAELGYRPATIDELEFVPVENLPTPAAAAGSEAQAQAAAPNPLEALWEQLVQALGGGP